MPKRIKKNKTIDIAPIIGDLNRIKELAKKQTLLFHFAALAEEVGEVAKDIMEGDKEHAKLECVDCFIAIMAIYFKLGGTLKIFTNRLTRSVNKWQQSLK